MDAKSNNNELNDNIDKHWILSAELHKALLSAVKANQYTDLYVLKFFSELAIISCQHIGNWNCIGWTSFWHATLYHIFRFDQLVNSFHGLQSEFSGTLGQNPSSN